MTRAFDYSHGRWTTLHRTTSEAQPWLDLPSRDQMRAAGPGIEAGNPVRFFSASSKRERTR
jgi:hypothetical protein